MGAPARAAVRSGAVLLLVGAVTELATAILSLSPVLSTVGWFSAGAGMGLMVPRISTLVLGWSVPGEEGFNVSAKSIADAVGGSVSLALAGLIFEAAAGLGEQASFVATFAYASVVAAVASVLAVRVGAAPRS